MTPIRLSDQKLEVRALEPRLLSERADALGQPVVVTGSAVRLLDVSEADEWEVVIVSSEDADPEADRISDQCPIGEALLGRRPGDLVFVDVPLGRVQYQVISVTHFADESPAHASV